MSLSLEKQINQTFEIITKARKDLRHAELEMKDRNLERWARESWEREVVKQQEIIEDAQLEVERLRMVIEARKLEMAE